jgi:hypothetical protein
MSQEFTIPVSEGQTVTAIKVSPEGDARDWFFIYAPGAGSNVHDPFGRYAAGRLADVGVASIRFQFVYTEAGKKRPDRNPVLEDTWRAVIDAVQPNKARLVVGGRSMGGRIASQIIARGPIADAVTLFAYPLYPPADPTRRRDAHLPDIAVPALFCSGTRDAFGAPDDLRAACDLVPDARLHLLDGADHGFSVPKASGRTRNDVWEEAMDVTVKWLEELDSAR